MRRPAYRFLLWSSVVTLVLLGAVCIAQDEFPPDTKAPPHPSARFLGTWESQINGEAWLTLILIESSGKMNGVLRRRQLPESGETPDRLFEARIIETRVLDTRPGAGRISFKTSDKETSVSETYELKLSGAGQGELSLLRPDSAGKKVLRTTWKVIKTASE